MIFLPFVIPVWIIHAAVSAALGAIFSFLLNVTVRPMLTSGKTC